MHVTRGVGKTTNETKKRTETGSHAQNKLRAHVCYSAKALAIKECSQYWFPMESVEVCWLVRLPKTASSWTYRC